jgi:hypothetical protein
MNFASHSNSNIPVLTEVISVDQAEPETARPQSAPAPQPQAPVAAAVPGLSAQDLEQLEKTLRENVLKQLLSRVDFVLEHRVRDSLADVLQTAVDGLARDIRQGLRNSLEEVVHRTVSQEISKIQSTSTKP